MVKDSLENLAKPSISNQCGKPLCRFLKLETFKFTHIVWKGRNRIVNKCCIIEVHFSAFWPSEVWCSTFSVDGVQSLGWFPTATAPGIEVVNYIAAAQHSEQFATYFLKWRYEYLDWRNILVLEMLSCYEHSSGACWHLDNKGSMFRQFMEYACTIINLYSYQH